MKLINKYNGIIVMALVSAPLLFSVPAVGVSPLSMTPQHLSGDVQSINWPLDNINFSQLESVFAQSPMLNQLVVNFPNQTSWNVTPATLAQIASQYQEQASLLGIKGKLPELAFSSLAGNGLSDGFANISINNSNGDIKSQLGNIMQQMKGNGQSLLDMLPDWLKNFCLMVYDAVYSAFDFLGSKLAGLVTR